MTPLEELLVKWHDRTLTREELAELNAWLSTAEGRARLRQEFAFDANLLEALLAAKARLEAGQQARAFETAEVRESEVFEGHPHRIWLATRRVFRGAKWKLALSAAATTAVVCFLLLRPAENETLAQIEGRAQGVTLVRGGKPVAWTGVMAVKSGDQIQTSAQNGATVAYLKEATTLELHTGTRLRLERTNAAHRLELAVGAITAKVAPQPKGQPMLVLTPHAEAMVMGTEFLLTVNAQFSRLDVLDGTIQFVNRDDGKSALVTGGFFAMAAKGVEMAARSLLEEPWHSQDVGEVGLAGAARLEGDRCTAKGAGRNTCLTKDQFHFVYQALDGDGEVMARIADLQMSHPGGKAGVVIRESLKTAAPHAFLFLRPDGNVEFEHRPAIESKSDRVGREGAPHWLRLTRKGDSITASISPDGQRWTKAGAVRIKMSKRIYIGLGVTSWDNASLATSVFDHVRVLASTR
ncbi:MAG: FecR domain-containing protein [Verrucomicrobia bacterium]|nr:FecR domain-containing protein [Verrucomicrobiota bacterium]